ncbi:MAG: type II toxin-antitoxin system RelE/ParE family toxin [Terracidiphilus sp.]
MEWEVEFTGEFGAWWDSLSAEEQDSVNYSVRLLQKQGPNLKRPHADTLEGSSFPNMRELRSQHEGRPYRVLYAFDPRRVGILPLGGDKTGNRRWYKEFIPKADELYRRHLRELETS